SVFTHSGNADGWLHRKSGYRGPGRLRSHSLLLLGQQADDIGADHVRSTVTAYVKQVGCILHEVDRGQILRGAGQKAAHGSVARVLDEPRSISSICSIANEGVKDRVVRNRGAYRWGSSPNPRGASAGTRFGAVDGVAPGFATAGRWSASGRGIRAVPRWQARAYFEGS